MTTDVIDIHRDPQTPGEASDERRDDHASIERLEAVGAAAAEGDTHWQLAITEKLSALTEAQGHLIRQLDGWKALLEGVAGRTDELITDSRDMRHWAVLRDADQTMIRLDQQRISQALHLRLGKLPSEQKPKKKRAQ